MRWQMVLIANSPVVFLSLHILSLKRQERVIHWTPLGTAPRVYYLISFPLHYGCPGTAVCTVFVCDRSPLQAGRSGTNLRSICRALRDCTT